jgi:ferredoxin
MCTKCDITYSPYRDGCMMCEHYAPNVIQKDKYKQTIEKIIEVKQQLCGS